MRRRTFIKSVLGVLVAHRFSLPWPGEVLKDPWDVFWDPSFNPVEASVDNLNSALADLVRQRREESLVYLAENLAEQFWEVANERLPTVTKMGLRFPTGTVLPVQAVHQGPKIRPDPALHGVLE